MTKEKTAEVYSLPGCVACDAVIHELHAHGFAVTVLGLATCKDRDVLRQAKRQNGAAPVVMVDGDPISPSQIIAGIL